MPNWFDVDKEGLAKLMEGRGKAFVIFELVQNAWDTEAKRVEIHPEKIPGSPKAKLTIIDDDPDGFKDFTHAWTLFAESGKKGDPTKRGLFNMGEKLVLALCYTAVISTTTGTVTFDNKGRHHSRKKRDSGSSFQATIRMNQEEYDECCDAVDRLIPPSGVVTYFNREALKERKPVAQFEATLPTTKSDDNGVVRPSRRATDVHIHETREGEEAFIYEKGIPVVATGDKWHIDVQQRVPLNMNRDNVTPAYLQQLRTLVINEMFADIEEEEASDDWVRDTLGDKRVAEQAFDNIKKKRYGEKAVIFDPSDPEANNIATSQGYTVIGGRSMSRGEHENNRKFGTILPAGQVTPSPKPFHKDGDPLNVLSEDEWTLEVRRVAEYAKRIGEEILDRQITVVIADDEEWGTLACYGEGELTLNLGVLGKKWFAWVGTFSGAQEINELLIHEFAHEKSSNHLSREFYDACCWIGARFVNLATSQPLLFKVDYP
jgi:hypothetical protein